MDNLIVKRSTIKGGGKGVFTAIDIKAGETIEVCETMIFDEAEARVLIASTKLCNYVYAHEDGKRVILALGKGSLYNHKSPSNAEYLFYAKKEQMYIVAATDIPKGKEIFINYGGSQHAPYVIDFY
ncbi:hypothetical protein OSTOST_13050 [Ostertagia ostertagi]|jgi:spore coat protein H